MALPLRPPVQPMLAKLVRELPVGDVLYEPKWDGFRCLAFRDGDAVDLRSRHDRPLSRYFPEVVEALLGVPFESFVVDGEIILVSRDGFDFAALMSRLHPAPSRVERLRRETPADLVGFDILALGDADLREVPFARRREELTELLGGAPPPLHLTPITEDPAVAAGWLARFQGGGIDGVVAKLRSLPYLPGKRSMLKVKTERTADCVVAGFRWYEDRPVLSSLLLALYDESGDLRHVGVVTSFTQGRRQELLRELEPYVTTLVGHPWENGFLIGRSPIGRLKGSAARWTPDMEHDWIPLRPELVCEVAFDQLDGERFRHPARFRRWRPDRDARSCTTEQLAATPPDVASVLPFR